MNTVQTFILAGITLFSGLFQSHRLVLNTPRKSLATQITKSLTPSSIPTPTNTPAPTLTPTPFTTATPTPTQIATPTPYPQPKANDAYAAEQINQFFDQFATQYAIDPHVLRHIAQCESGLNPHAQNLSYGGLFQFSPGSWETFRNLLGKDTNANLRFDAKEAIETAAYALHVGRGAIWPTCNH